MKNIAPGLLEPCDVRLVCDDFPVTLGKQELDHLENSATE